jgi:hypothetical protein
MPGWGPKGQGHPLRISLVGIDKFQADFVVPFVVHQSSQMFAHHSILGEQPSGNDKSRVKSYGQVREITNPG